MKKAYITPTTELVILCLPITLLDVSVRDAGGKKGYYEEEKGQLSREIHIWDDED